MDRKIFLEKISCTAKALRGSGELNILVKSGEMEVSAASEHLAVSNRFPVDCKDMSIAVKASTMMAIVGKIPEDEISLILNGETVLVKWKTGKASLPVFEFREVMRHCGDSTVHPVHHLTQYVGQVVHSLDNTGYSVQRSLRIIRYSFTPPSFFRIRSLVQLVEQKRWEGMI